MEWKSVRIPKEALDKLAKLRELVAKDLCDNEECRQRVMETMTAGRFFNAVVDVFLRGEERDYNTLSLANLSSASFGILTDFHSIGSK